MEVGIYAGFPVDRTSYVNWYGSWSEASAIDEVYRDEYAQHVLRVTTRTSEFWSSLNRFPECVLYKTELA